MGFERGTKEAVVKGSGSSAGNRDRVESGRVRGVASEEEGLLSECEAVPFERGQEPGAGGCYMPTAPGER